MAQFARPDSDVSATNISGLSINTAGSRYQNIDESTASNADYNYGASNTAASYECGLSDVTDPADHTNHVVRWQAAKVSGSGSITLTVFLMQGGSTIAQKTQTLSITGLFAADSFTLSSGEAASITDYTDLRLRFTQQQVSGRAVAFSWAELEVPDAPAGPTEVDINDTGSGSETYTIDSSSTLAETGAAVSEARSLDGAVAQSDTTAIGAEGQTVENTVPIADAATGAETHANAATIAQADSAAGSEALNFQTDFTVQDGVPGVFVSGSGSASSDGFYALTDTVNGKNRYYKGANIVYWHSGNFWALFDATLGTIAYSGTSDTTYPWQSGWIRESGDNPAPTLTEATGTSVGSESRAFSGTVLVPDTSTSSESNSTESSVDQVNIDDTAVGSETRPLAAYVSASEAGTGSETRSLVGAVSQEDTCSGSESQSLEVGIPVVDDATATGTETRTLEAVNSLSDNSTGTDTPSLASGAAVNDAGASGAETQALTAVLTAPDTSTGSDTPAEEVSALISDTATGSETRSLDAAAAAINDSSAGADTPIVAFEMAVGDADSAGAETQALTSVLTESDTATGTETPKADVSAFVIDAATGLENRVFAGEPVLPDDTAQSAEQADGANETLVVDTSAMGSETRAMAAEISLADAAEADDQPAAATEIAVADTATAADIPVIDIEAAVFDTASDDEALHLAGSALSEVSSIAGDAPSSDLGLLTTDEASGTDSPNLDAVASVDDGTAVSTEYSSGGNETLVLDNTALGAETRTFGAETLRDDDTAFGTDLPFLATEIVVTDAAGSIEDPATEYVAGVSEAGTSQEQLTLAAELERSDSAAAGDEATGTVDSIDSTVSDTAGGTESITFEFAIAIADVSASATEILNLSGSAPISDIGTGAAEVLDLSALASGADTGVSTDSLERENRVDVIDPSQSSEALDLTALLTPISDTGTAADWAGRDLEAIYRPPFHLRLEGSGVLEMRISGTEDMDIDMSLNLMDIEDSF